MIKSFVFENFKSFEKAELNLEALTSLVVRYRIRVGSVSDS